MFSVLLHESSALKDALDFAGFRKKSSCQKQQTNRQKTTLLFTKHVKQYIEKSQLALESPVIKQ